MYASAMTLLQRHDGDLFASYLDLADFIETQGGEKLSADLQQLFRRAVFNLLVGNRDDHLRNHGFIRLTSGWRLSPAFDLNPNSEKRQHVLTWDGQSADPDLEALTQTAPFYRIARRSDAQTIVDSVKRVVTSWRDKAKALQLTGLEVQRMERAFAA
jgi:serine/threonine-protein kinase HipA